LLNGRGDACARQAKRLGGARKTVRIDDTRKDAHRMDAIDHVSFLSGDE
jgi:hypothetical protein